MTFLRFLLPFLLLGLQVGLLLLLLLLSRATFHSFLLSHETGRHSQDSHKLKQKEVLPIRIHTLSLSKSVLLLGCGTLLLFFGGTLERARVGLLPPPPLPEAWDRGEPWEQNGSGSKQQGGASFCRNAITPFCGEKGFPAKVCITLLSAEFLMLSLADRVTRMLQKHG